MNIEFLKNVALAVAQEQHLERVLKMIVEGIGQEPDVALVRLLIPDLTGRLDVSSPLQTAWQLHQRWSKSQLIVVEIEGHGGAVMANEFTKAIANFVPAS